MKKIVVILMAMLMLVGTAAYADTEFQPGQRMGQQLEGEELENFKAEMIEKKEDWIYGLVEAGTITAEEGEAFISQLKDNMENCDGSQKFMGRSLNLGLGDGFGAKSGFRQNTGFGKGQGRGRWQADE